MTQSIVTRLAKVELPVRLLTPELGLRSLQEGDLLLSADRCTPAMGACLVVPR